MTTPVDATPSTPQVRLTEVETGLSPDFYNFNDEPHWVPTILSIIGVTGVTFALWTTLVPIDLLFEAESEALQTFFTVQSCAMGAGLIGLITAAVLDNKLSNP